MKTTTLVTGLLTLGAGLGCVVHAQQKQSAEDLKVDRERDTFAIAERLYNQGRTANLDATTRNNVLLRAEELLESFVKDFPESENRNKALYMRATCLETAKRDAQSQAVLKVLAASGKEGKSDDYVAAAAYRLATLDFARGINNANDTASLDSAIKYFELVRTFSTNVQLKYDATYRKARALTIRGQREPKARAEKSFAAAAALYSTNFTVAKDVPPHIVGAVQFAYAQLLTEMGGDSNLQTALTQYELFLKNENQNENQRSIATLQAARIATKLGQSDKATDYYAMLVKFPNMSQYAGEAKMETLYAYFRAKDYDKILAAFPQTAEESSFLQELKTHTERATCAAILGETHFQKEDYLKAASFFLLSEENARGTARGADAGYRLILCLQKLQNDVTARGKAADRLPGLSAYAQSYLQRYDSETATATRDLPCTDMVHVIYADQLLQLPNTDPLSHYKAVNIDNLPASIRADTAYKKAWCMYRAWNQNPCADNDPNAVLTDFISKYKDSVRMPDVLCMHGNYLFESKYYENAIKVFDRVINEYTNATAYPLCLQRAALACISCQPPKHAAAERYYKSLLEYSNNNEVSNYAIAEAHYNLAGILYDNRTLESIEHFKTASELDPERYSSSAAVCLIQCYFKLKNTHEATLLEALPKFKQEHPLEYTGLPRAIPRWCGWACFQKKQYIQSAEYLNDSIDRNRTEEYTAEDGTSARRPVAEPVVWITLARTCLEMGKYTSTDKFIGGIDAIDYYLSQETDPHRRAEGLRVKALMLNGMGELEKARTCCDEALKLGVNGPVLSSIRLAAGDTYFIELKYEEAAAMYGIVANFDNNNPDVNREALYKVAHALRMNGKEAEAAKYEKKLEEMGLDPQKALDGLPPSVSRHVNNKL